MGPELKSIIATWARAKLGFILLFLFYFAINVVCVYLTSTSNHVELRMIFLKKNNICGFNLNRLHLINTLISCLEEKLTRFSWR